MTGVPETVREHLERHDLWARKSLGQHFLLDLNITRKIARLCGDIAGETVIEVGPGPGGLTRALLEAGANPLFAIEKDARFIPLLAELAEESGGRLRILEADALAVDEAGLLEGSRAAIIANLPYNVATPLLIKWLKAGAWRGPMALMFQKEVAERVCARPGSGAYGRLAVIAQARCEARLALTLPARAFTPAPKVASAVVQLTDLAEPFDDLDGLERVTAAAFGQRRKMLRAALKSLTPAPETLLAQAGLAPEARAEEISVAGFCALARAWRAIGSSSNA